MTTADRRLRPRKQPRQRRSEQTRQRILAAAARVFAARGYAGGTTNHIAAEAGLSVGSLYQYFPNKDALLAELMRAHVREGAALVRRRLAEATADLGTDLAAGFGAGAGTDTGTGTGGTDSGSRSGTGSGGPAPDLAARLRPFVAAAIDNHRADPGLHRVLFEEAPRPAEVLRELHALEESAVATAASLLRADPQVAVPDPDLAAWFVVATIEALTHRYVSSGARGDLALDAFGDELVRLLVAYLSSPA